MAHGWRTFWNMDGEQSEHGRGTFWNIDGEVSRNMDEAHSATWMKICLGTIHGKKHLN